MAQTNTPSVVQPHADFVEASLILVMHQRYETLDAAFTRMQVEGAAAEEGTGWRYTDAEKSIFAEQDLLRLCILRSPPRTWAEASACLLHLDNSYDLLADSEGQDWSEAEAEAIRVAIQNLFAFFADPARSSAPAAVDLGPAFMTEASRTLSRRAFRDGKTKG